MDNANRIEDLSSLRYSCLLLCFVGNFGVAIALFVFSLQNSQKEIQNFDVAAAIFSLAGYLLYWYLTSDYRRNISRRRCKLYLNDVCFYISALLGIALAITGLVLSATDKTEVYRISYITIYSLDCFFVIPVTIHWVIAGRNGHGEYNTLP